MDSPDHVEKTAEDVPTEGFRLWQVLTRAPEIEDRYSLYWVCLVGLCHYDQNASPLDAYDYADPLIRDEAAQARLAIDGP